MKVALLLNTNALGGAERSIIEQLGLVQEKISLSIFIPKLSKSSDKVLALVGKKLNTSASYYRMPKAFYSLSQQGKFLRIAVAAVSLLSAPLYFKDMAPLKDSEVLYCNGNKIAIWTLIWAFMAGYKGKIIWHFRDYPSQKMAFKDFMNFMSKKFGSRLCIAANSKSVSDSLKEIGVEHVDVIYNIVGEMPEQTFSANIETIGVVSMMASWKGIHQVLLMAHLYEKELKELGIKNIDIFSSEIYQTAGDHLTYSNELQELMAKFPSSLLNIKYNQTPDQIFKQIDLLIHPSLQKEPFGRVILEAFRSNVPVISTAMGGANELIEQGMNGLTFFKYDYAGLFLQIKNLVMNPELRKNIADNAYKKSFEIESNVKAGMEHLLGVA
ncbi:MAG: glycosyltransferase family 4 protein [Bacteriovorax sp.]|nr:glycosyltransferase family 4 protein [Bacteriovorax sp.]